MIRQQPHIRPDVVHNRAAFSLVELMVVLLILAILMGLIVPAVMRGGNTARVAQVKAEMESLKASMTQFKVEFGVEPPSGITIHESAATWASDPLSRRTVKQLWPQFNFGIDRDFNGDGDMTDNVTLDGAECLVFFLGGMVDGTSGALRGFSKNPANPFSIDNGTRMGPYYEFSNSGIDPVSRKPTGRLVDTDNDGAPEYVDPMPSQTTPYFYFSSYGGTGYRTGDGGGRMLPYYTDSALTIPFNRDGFQLISPGADFQFGTGGFFSASDANWTTVPTGQSQRVRDEMDNITNFHPGTLGGN